MVYVLDVFVPGVPAPQGSVKAFIHKHTGRAVVVKDNNRTQKAWRELVRRTVTLSWRKLPIDGPVTIRCDFVMPRPVATPARATPPAIRKPDGDKLERAVWDALTGVVWVDDARVTNWSGSKRLAELGQAPGCRIRVAVDQLQLTPAATP
jgi:Holliday junction resolvase RusA-like endonuclease